MSNRCTTVKQVNHYKESALSGVEFPFASQKAFKNRHITSSENERVSDAATEVHILFIKQVILQLRLQITLAPREINEQYMNYQLVTNRNSSNTSEGKRKRQS